MKYKKNTRRWLSVLLSVAVCLTSILAINVYKAEAANMVIVLDAGHDDTHAGAQGNGKSEEDLNLKIAKACREELLKYQGVTVYMIRSEEKCPYGGSSVGNSKKCNQKRVDYAKKVGADVYVSLHNNSSTSSAAKGAGVYYPTTNYNKRCGNIGKGLASSVLKQLTSMGLENRGISVRYSEDNTRYSDGSLADYYAVIKNNKKNNIPAIIVEHAFISNKSDVKNYLNTDAQLKKLGVADATGIANYYGLKKKATTPANTLDYSKAKYTATAQDGNTKMLLKATNVKNASKVYFDVWSERNGTDDKVRYEAKKDSSGIWKTTVSLAKHASQGKYIVKVYANSNVLIGSTNFTVKAPTVQSVAVYKYDKQKGYFGLKVSGIKTQSKVQYVKFAIWTKEDKSDLKWFTAQKQSDGTYIKENINISNFGYTYGDYHVQTFVRDQLGFTVMAHKKVMDFRAESPKISAVDMASPAMLKITVSNVPYGNGVSKIAMEILENKNSNKAISQYMMTKSSQMWTNTVNIGKLGLGKQCYVKLTAHLVNGKKVLLGGVNYNINNGDQNLKAVVENDEFVWNGKGISISSAKGFENQNINVNMNLDYDTWMSKLKGDSHERYGNMIAYKITKEPGNDVIISGDAVVNPDVVTSGDAVVSPDTVISGDAVVSPDAVISGDAVISPDAVISGDAVVSPDAVISGDAVISPEAVTKEPVISEKITPESVVAKDKIKFAIPDNMQKNEVVVYKIDNEHNLIMLEADVSKNKESVTVEAEADGIFVIAQRVKRVAGDADFSGAVELSDAQKVLRAALLLDSVAKSNEMYYDVDGQSGIQLSDAQMVLRAALLLIKL